MIILETDRLILRLLTPADAEFILRLLNEPSWLRFIGDRGVRTLADARNYIEDGPLQMYARYGYCLYLVALKDGTVPAGMCGLIKRDFLDAADIGFAFLPEFWGKNYAYEAARAVLDYGKNSLAMTRILAITSPDNDSSIKLLEKLGLRFERMITYPNDQKELRLFAIDL